MPTRRKTARRAPETGRVLWRLDGSNYPVKFRTIYNSPGLGLTAEIIDGDGKTRFATRTQAGPLCGPCTTKHDRHMKGHIPRHCENCISVRINFWKGHE